MIRDRDRIYGAVVTRRLRAMGIRDKQIAPASLWQSSFAERLIGSMRRDCLDNILGRGTFALDSNFLCRLLQLRRTRRSLHKNAPIYRPIQQTGIIRSHPILGGLHHRYVPVRYTQAYWLIFRRSSSLRSRRSWPALSPGSIRSSCSVSSVSGAEVGLTVIRWSGPFRGRGTLWRGLASVIHRWALA